MGRRLVAYIKKINKQKNQKTTKFGTTSPNRVKILNENTQKYVDLPIVERNHPFVIFIDFKHKKALQ
jgi:hypothetical protein